MPRRTAEDAARTRASVLDAALLEFAAVGYAPATLDGIARRAGVTRGAVYHHFAGKPDVLRAVLHELWTPTLAPITGLLDAPAPDPGAVRAFVQALVDAMNTDERVLALLTISTQSEWSPTEPDADADAAAKLASLRAWEDALRPHLSPAATPGDRAATARAVVLALVGYGLERGIAGAEPPARRAAFCQALMRVAEAT